MLAQTSCLDSLLPLRGAAEAEECNLFAPSLMVLSRPTCAPTSISCGYTTTYPRNPVACARAHPDTVPAQSSAPSSYVSLAPGIAPFSLAFFPFFTHKKTPGAASPTPRAFAAPETCHPNNVAVICPARHLISSSPAPPRTRANPRRVRSTLTANPNLILFFRGRLAQVDRALVSGTKGRAFESPIAHQRISRG